MAASDATLGRTASLAAEFLALFAVGPVLWWLGWVRPPLMLVLPTLALGAWWWLRRDPTFDRSQFWNAPAARAALPAILRRWLACAIGLILLMLVFVPDSLFSLPRERPALWALIMVAYPLWSVSAQGLIYRNFIFHRYREFFPTPATMIPAAAAAFAFGHVIFDNWMAVALTAVGGVFFSLTYQRTKSALAAAIEHALYGNTVFTLGLGSYLVAGHAL